MIPMTPYPPAPPVNAYANQQITQGIANAFGPFFFNMHDPNIAKTNIPMKQSASMHIPVIVVTLLLIAGIIIGIILFGKYHIPSGGAILIVGSYLIYLAVTICMSDIRGYITNLRQFH
jgi:hypothetical protein